MRELRGALLLRDSAAWGVWDAVVGFVIKSLASEQRGIAVPGLGRWTLAKAADGGREPVFTADPAFLGSHGLASKGSATKHVVAASSMLNLVAVARAAGVDKERARECLRLAISTIGGAAAAGGRVNLKIGHLGVLQIQGRVLQFKTGLAKSSRSLPNLPSTAPSRQQGLIASSPITTNVGEPATGRRGSLQSTARASTACVFEERKKPSPWRLQTQFSVDEGELSGRTRSARFKELPRFETRAARSDNFGMAHHDRDDGLLYQRKYPSYSKEEGLQGAFTTCKKSARSLTLKKAYERYGDSLRSAEEERRLGVLKCAELQRLAQRRREKRIEEDAAAIVSLNSTRARQAVGQRERRDQEVEGRRRGRDSDPGRAYPIEKAYDWVTEQRDRTRLHEALRLQEEEKNERAVRALRATRQADAAEVQRFVKCVDKDAVVSQLIDAKLQRQLAVEWDRQIELTKHANALTKSGASIIR